VCKVSPVIAIKKFSSTSIRLPTSNLISFEFFISIHKNFSFVNNKKEPHKKEDCTTRNSIASQISHNISLDKHEFINILHKKISSYTTKKYNLKSHKISNAIGELPCTVLLFQAVAIPNPPIEHRNESRRESRYCDILNNFRCRQIS
jgi:hypothetical protein